jgi:drug/metabolite transporter (DMT)-like permease
MMMADNGKEKFPFPPIGILFLGVLGSSFSAPLIRATLSHPLTVASFRMIFTVILLAPIAIREVKRGNWQKMSSRTLVLSIISGIFLALHFATWISSVGLTSIANSTVLVSTHPLLVLLGGAIFLKERIALRGVLGILIALAGSTLLALFDTGKHPSVFTGDLLAIAGALAFAVYLLIGRTVRKEVPLSQYTLVVYGTSAITLVAITLAWGVPLKASRPEDYLYFLALGLVCTLMGHSLINYSLAHLKTTLVSTGIVIEPVFATLLGVIFYQEIPPPRGILASLLVIGGLAILIYSERRFKRGFGARR